MITSGKYEHNFLVMLNWLTKTQMKSAKYSIQLYKLVDEEVYR